MVPALAANHHVIRVDLPGCGQSPPAPSYGVPAQASFSLCTCSAGAAIAA